MEQLKKMIVYDLDQAVQESKVFIIFYAIWL